MTWDNSKLQATFKRVLSGFLTLLFCLQHYLLIPVMAKSTISGVNGTTTNGSSTYNINPDFKTGDTGFKYYNSFNLSQGDIANLIFQLKNNGGDVSKFVNLVNNQIVINGILNSMKNGSFYDGHAIFVSPNGMVVGASGVINVGALTAIAPNAIDYAKYAAYNLDSAPAGIAQQYSDLIDTPLGKDAIKISGYLNQHFNSNEVSQEILKNADQTGNIDIQGKI